MATAAFTDIRKKIQNSIAQSKECILVSVAWLTSKDLLGQLIDKLESGCNVEIIISDHFENQRLNFEKFVEKGGQIFIIPSKGSKFLHDKFAIFDNVKLIAGSYNWTNSAEFYNHEFIIQSEDPKLIKQFSIRFKNLKEIVVQYDKLKLLNTNQLTAESKEEEFVKLEEELEQEFINTLNEANDLGAKINSINVIPYLHKYGAIGGASRLISVGLDKLHSGLVKLWEINRLDISFEGIILKDKYRVLFSKDILEKAQKRLDELK